MKFRSFFWILLTGAVAIFLFAVVSLGWLATQSSIKLLRGGVNTFPQAAVFIPKQAPAMASLLTNPEKLEALRQVSLPLNRRQSDRTEWQQWETDLLATIGFDYQRDLKPWLGDEITLAITTLDYDRNPDNGAQPGYMLAMKTRNTKLAQKSLGNFFGEQVDVSIEKYKGVNIISPDSLPSNANPDLWASAVVGNFVLFANHPQILKQAINQAQAVNLNLDRADFYQTAMREIEKPHLGVAYLNILGTSAWLDKSPLLTKPNVDKTLSLSLSITPSGLAAQSSLIGFSAPQANSEVEKSFLDKPELQQIFNSLAFDRQNSTYIDLRAKKSLLEAQIPLYKVTKLAIKSIFPHLKAIAIRNLGNQDGISRAEFLFELDS